ncbi:TetR/AcrR family transcriptional regulator [Falsiroseomonas sp. E2-1-a4]|uniref:TetR/AcrR family transcriptional regulator n=1 Tax=Falsiroseomonas sp. E2-1-a4 TaxID=3239299 RepID=UPI003F2B7DB5
MCYADDTMPKSRPHTPPPRDTSERYHHGNLVDALVAATIAIIEERGVEHVSVREAARRVGVSPGAPFRHFATKTALMTAVAEQAMNRLKASVDAALDGRKTDAPLVQLEALGAAYLGWALQNPTHFAVISSRTLIDITASDSIQRANNEIRGVMARLFEQARMDGTLAPDLGIDHLVLVTRALGYGLARMAIDGHFPEWHASEPPADVLPKALTLFMSLLRSKTAPPGAEDP